MAEYQVVMHHLGRMCETYSSCSDGCPLQEEPNVCFLSAKSLSTDAIKATEQAIMQWAAENPEPVYETWYEYLEKQHVVAAANSGQFENIHFNDIVVPTLEMFKPIPADIAQKLGIEPKGKS